MTSQLPFYERPVLLDRDKHRHLRVKAGVGYAFARAANSVMLTGVEFAEAMKEYPIAFSRGPGARAVPVAMLGLRAGENLFVGADGRWLSPWIPALVRRYPFVLAQLPNGAVGACIDEACPGLEGTEGEALFDATGANTPYLKSALDFLAQWQREFLRTQAFCARLEEFGLLRELNAKADLKDGRSFTVTGLLVVDEQKLRSLSDDAALSLFRSGELNLVSMHLASLSNMQKLVDRVAEQPPARRPAPKPGA